MKRLLTVIILLMLLCTSTIAEQNEKLEKYVLDTCLERGLNARCFPADITPEELLLERYDIHAFEHTYSIWIMTSIRQLKGVEFGWVAYHTQNCKFDSSGRSLKGYEELQYRLKLETELGSCHFWTPEQKADYYHWLYGEKASIVSPTEKDIPVQEAVERAEQALHTELGLSLEQIEQYLVETTLYHEQGSFDIQGHKRYWGLSFRMDAIPFPVCYIVTLAAETGEILYAIEMED